MKVAAEKQLQTSILEFPNPFFVLIGFCLRFFEVDSLDDREPESSQESGIPCESRQGQEVKVFASGSTVCVCVCV